MALTGFSKTCSKRCGGIKHIYLAGANDIASVTYVQNAATAITMNNLAVFVKYDFEEDAASFSENATVMSGSYCVEHTLSFAFGKLSGASLNAVEELIAESYDGIVAIITTNNNDSFLIGHSERLGVERALRLTETSSVTGKKLKDSTSRTVTLYCCDTNGAVPFSGTIPTA